MGQTQAELVRERTIATTDYVASNPNDMHPASHAHQILGVRRSINLSPSATATCHHTHIRLVNLDFVQVRHVDDDSIINTAGSRVVIPTAFDRNLQIRSDAKDISGCLANLRIIERSTHLVAKRMAMETS